MTVVGFNFTKISAKRKNVVKGKINIANNISVTNVEKANLSLGDSKQEGLKFTFKFVSEYKPDVGNIEIEGETIYMADIKKTEEILSEWTKNKKVTQDVMTNILNVVLSKCNIEALILSKDINLPPPIPLPKVGVKKKE